MTEKQIDQVCLGYFHAIALILFAIGVVAIPFVITNGEYIPPTMIGGGFALFTWGLLHIQFRRKLSGMTDTANEPKRSIDV